MESKPHRGGLTSHPDSSVLTGENGPGNTLLAAVTTLTYPELEAQLSGHVRISAHNVPIPFHLLFKPELLSGMQ